MQPENSHLAALFAIAINQHCCSKRWLLALV